MSEKKSNKRTYDERLREKQEQLERTMKKLSQQREQLKQLKVKQQSEERKKRTHKLIVAGAELAAMYGHVLDKDEVYELIGFLKEQKAQGVFDLTVKEEQAKEDVVKEQEENTEHKDDFMFDDIFNF